MNILIISPQRWQLPYISKHYYALELLKRGAKVFFIEPVLKSLKAGQIQIEKNKNYPGLTIIRYNTFFPYKLKFHAYYIFIKLMSIQIKRIVKKLSLPSLDLLLDFDNTGNINNHKIFKAQKSIFFPVDVVLINPESGRNADLVVSISQECLDRVNSPAPKRLIGHGLNELFVQMANERLDHIDNTTTNQKIDKRLRASLVGNLNINCIDTQSIMSIVRDHPEIDFHFFGNSDLINHLADQYKMLLFLKNKDNVFLHGIVDANTLTLELPKSDILWYAYQQSESYKADNSHKILEYLATGKVVVGSYLSHYKTLNLIRMSSDTETTAQVFNHVVNNLEKYNDFKLQKQRIQYALKNSYAIHLDQLLDTLAN